jgi:TRAP-type C4-dicarboxylate transport system permease small subunit
MPTSPSAWQRVASFFNRLEEVVLGSLLSAMVLLGCLQVLSRNILSVSLFWVDPLLRHLVLWIALLGASVATRQERHISIDMLSGRLSARSHALIRAIIHLFSAAVCLLLVLPAIRFVQEEYPAGKILALGIPNWVSESIIPLMLAVLGIRFLAKFWNDLTQPNRGL